MSKLKIANRIFRPIQLVAGIAIMVFGAFVGRPILSAMGAVHAVLAALLLMGCAVETRAPSPSGPTHVVTWSATGISDSPGAPDPIACTELISHPCPLMLYMLRLDITPGFSSSTTSGSVNLSWWDGAGGADFNGRTAEDEQPIAEIAHTKDGALELSDRSDDGGFRHATTLSPIVDGWEGDLSWSLFNEPGHTTWHLTITED